MILSDVLVVNSERPDFYFDPAEKVFTHEPLERNIPLALVYSYRNGKYENGKYEVRYIYNYLEHGSLYGKFDHVTNFNDMSDMDI